jgi:hypothetical protein
MSKCKMPRRRSLNDIDYHVRTKIEAITPESTEEFNVSIAGDTATENQADQIYSISASRRQAKKPEK